MQIIFNVVWIIFSFTAYFAHFLQNEVNTACSSWHLSNLTCFNKMTDKCVENNWPQALIYQQHKISLKVIRLSSFLLESSLAVLAAVCEPGVGCMTHQKTGARALLACSPGCPAAPALWSSRCDTYTLPGRIR